MTVVGFTIDLSGRRCLVTGAGRGVGRGIARALAAAGADVVVNDIDGERTQAVVDEISSAGGSALPLAFDVTDSHSVARSISALRPGIDVLVNNAGNAGVAGFSIAPFAATEPKDWQRYFDINLFGVLHCTHAALPAMIDSGFGRVITIISDAARTGEPNLAAYAAAKGGAASFSRALAHEVGRSGITVNNVSLATMQSDEADQSGTDDAASSEEAEVLERRMRRYIVRRPGTPDDVAGLVTFMASEHSSWITGQTIPVNGGYSINQ